MTVSNALSAICFSFVLLSANPADAGRLLDAAPFSIPADELLDLTQSLAGPQEDAGLVDLILSHTTRTLHKNGTTRLRLHSVYRIRTNGDAGSWQSLRYGYSAAHEARPVLKARVVTPNGKTYMLNEKAIPSAVLFIPATSSRTRPTVAAGGVRLSR
jgi:hypothetical protein